MIVSTVDKAREGGERDGHVNSVESGLRKWSTMRKLWKEVIANSGDVVGVWTL